MINDYSLITYLHIFVYACAELSFISVDLTYIIPLYIYHGGRDKNIIFWILLEVLLNRESARWAGVMGYILFFSNAAFASCD